MPTASYTLDKIADLIARDLRTYRNLVLHADGNGRSVEGAPILRRVAERLVDAREHFFVTAAGDPDWRGSTAAYRNFYASAMSRARLPDAERARLQNSIRYHVSDVVRERLDEAQLEDLGLTTESARERGARHNERRSEIQALFAGGGPLEDPEEILLALERIRFFARRVQGSAIAEGGAHLRGEFTATIAALKDARDRRARSFVATRRTARKAGGPRNDRTK